MEQIERLIARDPGGRGSAALQVPGDLGGAAGALARARHVAIATGFPVGPHAVAETDGPPGALFLGRALTRLGKGVTFITHRNCVGVMAAGMAALGLNGPLERLRPGEGPEALLNRIQPDLVATVELPGRAADGQYYNMRGLSITPRVEALDGLLMAAAQRSMPTVAVGDGGNEAGMGKVRQQVHAVVAGGELIASVVGCDHLVAAGTSNWGAYGLVAALDRALLHHVDEEADLLAKLVAAGALDGARLTPTATVDGLEPGEYVEVLAHLHHWEAGGRVTA